MFVYVLMVTSPDLGGRFVMLDIYKTEEPAYKGKEEFLQSREGMAGFGAYVYSHQCGE